MAQKLISFLLMRGGTSRGVYLRRDDLPDDLNELSALLVSMLGTEHRLNIDGIGGGHSLTNKVAMLSKSDDEWADVDYFLAQLSGEGDMVDFKPTCGNILSAVGPAAIEMGLVQASEYETAVKIRAVNTGAKITARVQTNNRSVCYEGDTKIAGVPGMAAPIELNFLDVMGSSTGQLLPTGNLIDVIEGIPISCLDVAMPTMIARASDFNLSGYEPFDQLEGNEDLFKRIERIRRQAGQLMGLGDVSASVMPKVALLAKPIQNGSVHLRYFTPWELHPSVAVTASQSIASCLLMDGTIADGLVKKPEGNPAIITLEHPSGMTELGISYGIKNGEFIHQSSSMTRTARKIAAGTVFL